MTSIHEIGNGLSEAIQHIGYGAEAAATEQQASEQRRARIEAITQKLGELASELDILASEGNDAYRSLTEGEENFEKAGDTVKRVMHGTELPGIIAELLGQVRSEEQVTGFPAARNSVILEMSLLDEARSSLAGMGGHIQAAAHAASRNTAQMRETRQGGATAIDKIRSYAADHHIPLTES